MHERSLDSMASDSYLLKAPPCPLQPCQCRHAKARTSTSCGVVLALVVLLGAVMALAALAYCQRMETTDLRQRVHDMRDKILAVSAMLDRLHLLDQIRTFEAQIPGDHGDDQPDAPREDYDEDESDDMDPYYDDDVENTALVEGKGRVQDGSPAVVTRLEPAGGLEHHDDDDATTTTTPEMLHMDRRRRDVRQAGAGRSQPQLKLYHMLQSPGLSAAAPPDQWSQYGARPLDRRQPLYAEHAPMAFVTPPQRHAGTTAAPIASRRSRVMDAVATPAEPAPHRRRHQHRLQQRQGGFPLQNLQDVTQEVPQGSRNVEVGRRRWQQPPPQQRQQQQWPSPTPRPSPWSPTERAGRWRDPWQDRVRATRVTDTHQR